MRRGKWRRAIWREQDLVKEVVTEENADGSNLIGTERVSAVKAGARPLGFDPAPPREIKEVELRDGRVMKVLIAPGQRINLKKEYARQRKAGIL